MVQEEENNEFKFKIKAEIENMINKIVNLENESIEANVKKLSIYLVFIPEMIT